MGFCPQEAKLTLFIVLFNSEGILTIKKGGENGEGTCWGNLR